MIKTLLSIFLLVSGCIGFCQELNFNPKHSKYQLTRGHLFDPHYDFTNVIIDSLLINSRKKSKTANIFLFASGGALFHPIGILALPITITTGAIMKNKSRKLFSQATILHNHELLSGQTFSGSEDFREPPNAQWFYRKNFHVQHYDGQNLEINDLLTASLTYKTRANKKLRWMTLFVGASGTFAFVTASNFIDNALSNGPGDRPIFLPLFSSLVFGGLGIHFFIDYNRNHTLAYDNLEKAAYLWYDELNTQFEE